MVEAYTTQEAADLQGVTYEACKKRITRAGLVPTRVIGRNNLYSEAQVEALRTVKGDDRSD